MKRIIAISFILLMALANAGAETADRLDVIDEAHLNQKIAAHDGKTVVVLWAPWCPHCVREMKMVRDNAGFFTDNNLQVIGLARQKDTKSAARMVREENFGFPVYAMEETLNRKLNPVGSIPVTIVFDGDAVMLDREWGAKCLEDIELMIEDF